MIRKAQCHIAVDSYIIVIPSDDFHEEMNDVDLSLEAVAIAAAANQKAIWGTVPISWREWLMQQRLRWQR